LQTNFPELFSNLRFDDSSWSKWNSSTECELKFPQDKEITPFQQLLVIQAFRPDRLESAMRLFVCSLLGIQDISPETLNLKKLYSKETISTESILIIISPGADPSTELRDLATEITGKDRYSEVNTPISKKLFSIYSNPLDCYGTRSNANRSGSFKKMFQSRYLVMLKKPSFSNSMVIHT
jgi:dynein heavy chain 2